MPYETPEALFDAVVSSRGSGDRLTYLDCYEPHATIVSQPGSIGAGREAVSAFLDFYLSLQPTFTVKKRSFVKGDGITLHLSSWVLTGTDQEGKAFEWNGRTCDVLRRQADGGWLVALDNPWGTALLDD